MSKEMKLVVHDIATENTLNNICSIQAIHAISSKVPILSTMHFNILWQKFDSILAVEAYRSCEMGPILKLIFNNSD